MFLITFLEKQTKNPMITIIMNILYFFKLSLKTITHTYCICFFFYKVFEEKNSIITKGLTLTA